MSNKLMAGLFTGVCVMALGSSAFAQAASGTDTVDSVVVTATRIQVNGYTQPTPVTVAPIEQLQQTTPSNIPDALNKLPQFSGSVQVASNCIGQCGFISTFTGNFLNLRNMATIRTLILLDGRRVAPTALNGTVDTNTLPQALIQRVDVVTGGASAVYGSDAVTGVVNFVLDTHYTGAKVMVQNGFSDYGDAPSFRAQAAFGAELFGGKGHLIVSAEHYQYDGVETNEDRPYSRNNVLSGAGTTANPWTVVSGATIATQSFGGLVQTGPFKGQQFVGAGQLAPFNVGTPTRTPGISIGGDGAWQIGSVLIYPLRNDQAFGRFEYNFSPAVTGFVQANYSLNGSPNARRAGTGPIGLAIFSGNPYLPAAAQAQLTAANVDSFAMNRLSADLGQASSASQFARTFNITAGLQGELLGRYKWDAYYSHSDNRLSNRRDKNLNNIKFLAALDAVRDPGGAIVCRVTITNPGLYPGCQPINMLGVGNQSKEALAYVFESSRYDVYNKMDDYAASISGDVFNAWAGPLSVALNTEYRRQTYAQTTSYDPNAPLPPTTGIRIGPGSTFLSSLYTADSQAPQHGRQSVFEVGGEAVLPLIRDFSLIKRLDVSGAARYTDYSTSGKIWSWKAGLSYTPFDDLRFRFTRSRDIRAPSLQDLFGTSSSTGVQLSDPHTGTNGQVSLRSGGNPNLKPEIAHTTTIGAVYSPSWLPRFQASIDYFDINVTDGIATLTGNQFPTLAECEQSGGTSPLCALIVRPLPFSDRTPANFPTQALSTLLNVAAQFTHGIDVEASYRLPLAQVSPSIPGDLNLRVLYTYQPVNKSQSFASSPVVNASGAAGLAVHRVTFLAGYTVGPLSVNWQTRYSSPIIQNANPLLIYVNPQLPSYTIHDANVAYRFKVAGADLQASLAVSNLFNKAPRIAPPSAFGGLPGFSSGAVAGDDLMGRYYNFTLKAQF